MDKGSGYRVQGTGDREDGSKKLEEDNSLWSVVYGQTSKVNLPVGAVVQVSSSPVVDRNDKVWQDYLARKSNDEKKAPDAFLAHTR